MDKLVEMSPKFRSKIKWNLKHILVGMVFSNTFMSHKPVSSEVVLFVLLIQIVQLLRINRLGKNVQKENNNRLHTNGKIFYLLFCFLLLFKETCKDCAPLPLETTHNF